MTMSRVTSWLPAAAALALIAATAAADSVRVGDRPAPLREEPDERAAIVATVAAGCELQAGYRDGDWLWVVATEPAGAGRSGWIRRQALTADPVPSPAQTSNDNAASRETSAGAQNGQTIISSQRRVTLGAVADAARAASAAARERAGNATAGGRRAPIVGSAEPPAPVGGSSGERGSLLGDWILPRALRVSFAFNYQSADVRQALHSMNERLQGGGGTIGASFAVLDPRILTVDFAGDLQLSRTTSRASLASFRNTSGLRSYRLDLGVLTGLKAPLRVFADRTDSTSNLQPSGATLDSTRRTRGVRRGLGFSWDINVDRLPRIQLSASTGRQLDERNYLFGYSSTNDEKRAEIRASRDHARGRYEIDFTHGDFAYDVPAAGVRSATASDVFQAIGRLTPTSRFALDVHARATRFRFGAGRQDSRVSGAGGDVAARYRIGANFAATGRYSFSNNAFEAALSGQLDASQPGATPVTTSSQLQERTRFQDGETRLEYTTRPLTAAVVLKTVSFGVPAHLATTLSDLTTAGGLVRTERTWLGLSWHAGADAALGRAHSNQRAEQPYHEAGIDAGMSRDLGTRLRFGADTSVRRIGRLSFFPVNLEARNATLRLETMRPGWARLRVIVTRFDNLRDVLYSDSRDRHTGYSLGLAGGRYDLSADIDQTDTHALLLAPGVLGSRPEVAILIASRPDLFRNLLAASDRTRVLALQVRPLAGLQLQARVRRQEQVYPGLFGFRLQGGQAWASYQIRELQLEVGWEYFDSWTSFGAVRDRRVYFRVRRDVTIF